MDDILEKLRSAEHAGRLSQGGRSQLTESLGLAASSGEMGWQPYALSPPPPPSTVRFGKAAPSTRAYFCSTLSGPPRPPMSGNGSMNGEADREMVKLLEERNNDLESQLTDVWDQVSE